MQNVYLRSQDNVVPLLFLQPAANVFICEALGLCLRWNRVPATKHKMKHENNGPQQETKP